MLDQPKASERFLFSHGSSFGWTLFATLACPQKPETPGPRAAESSASGMLELHGTRQTAYPKAAELWRSVSTACLKTGLETGSLPAWLKSQKNSFGVSTLCAAFMCNCIRAPSSEPGLREAFPGCHPGHSQKIMISDSVYPETVRAEISGETPATPKRSFWSFWEMHRYASPDSKVFAKRGWLDIWRFM